jgi:cyclopropane fatty-acyl-phospholipid synthase-like methyltransferase
VTRMRSPDDIETYYARRADEYDRIYLLPERQPDLQRLREVLLAFGDGRRLLEIACGTGYWTEVAAPVAAGIVATDAVEEVLAVARGRVVHQQRATFVCADAFGLDSVAGEFDAAFAGFWWSHVGRERLAEFLVKLQRRLGAGNLLFFDNRFVVGSSTPISRTDDAGNSYQHRVLADGSEYEIIKNYPSAAEIRSIVADVGGRSVQVEELQYYWYATCAVGGAA